MKKIFFSLLAIAAIASCAKTEAVYTEGDNEIKLAPVTALQTKANFLGAVDGTVYPTQENFDVYAYWKNVEAGQKFEDGSLFLESLTEGGAEFENKGNYWGGLVKYYWPKNGSLRFAAYSPAHLTVDHALVNDVYSITNYEQKSNTAETFDFLVAPTSPSYTMMTAAEKVAIEFQHALSWITLRVIAKDADAAKAFDIKKVTINDVNTKAAFVASMTDGIQYDEWSYQNTPVPYVVFEGSQKVTQTLTDIESTVAGTLVIPQSTTSVTIDFDQYGVNGTADTPGMTQTLDLVLDKDDAPWEPGKHYIYNLIFGLDEILINPSVADWKDECVGEFDVDAANVSTSAQFVAAVANGGKVTLQDNIELEQAVTITNDVVLELNGYELTYTSDVAAHSAMITVNSGAELIVRDCERNGKGKISYEYTGAGDSNFTWGSYTIANNGELYVENGTIEIICGLNNPTVNTHMYCAIQQGGNANSKTVISGGNILNATYRSIRANQGSLKIYDGANIEGQVWMQPFAATTSLEIVGGNFQPTGGDGSSVFVTNNQYPVNVLVRGGNFATKIGASDATDVAKGAKGSIIGGTFADKTGLNENLIADGYSLAQQGSVWTVVKGEYDAVAGNFDDLTTAVSKGENVLFATNFTATSTGSNGYGKTGLSQTKGGVIDGNGHDFASPNSNGTWDSAISTTGGTIKNLNIIQGFRGVFIKKGTEKVYLENVKFNGTTYTISCDEASHQGLEARNCTFNGWTSFAGTLGNVYFLGCSFGAGSGYKYCRPYAPTVFEGCNFCEGFKVDPCAKVVFYNCTINNVALTADNLSTLVTGNIANASVK